MAGEIFHADILNIKYNVIFLSWCIPKSPKKKQRIERLDTDHLPSQYRLRCYEVLREV